MRIAFYTNLTSNESLPVLEQLCRSTEHSLVHVYFYDTLAQAKKSPIKILREFGVRRLAKKIVSNLASRIRRLLLAGPGRNWFRPQSALELAIVQNLPYSIISDLNSRQETHGMAARNLDLLLVCVCKNILKTATINTPRLRTLNIHPSLLPKYRGPMPIFWTLYYEESIAGVSFQYMTAQIDAGPVVAQYELPIAGQSSEEKLSRELFSLAAKHLLDVLKRIADSNAQNAVALDLEAGSYHSYPTRQQEAELRSRKSRL